MLRFFGKLDSVFTKARDATIISNVMSYRKTDRSIILLRKRALSMGTLHILFLAHFPKQSSHQKTQWMSRAKGERKIP